MTSKNNSGYNCLNCLHFRRTKNKLQSHKKVFENKDSWNVILHSEDTKILEFNQYQKFDKASLTIYADHERIIEKIDGCKNNPESSSTTKVSKHIPSGFSMSALSSFRSIENKHDACRGKDCMKRFCEFLREYAIKIINFKKKKMKVLTKEQQEWYENRKICCILKKNLKINIWKIKNIVKLEIIINGHYTGVYRGAAHSIFNVKYIVFKKNFIVFHKISNYDFHFIIKELAEEFKKQLTSLGENTTKYIAFTVPIEKEFTRTDKKWRRNYKKDIVNITIYR